MSAGGVYFTKYLLQREAFCAILTNGKIILTQRREVTFNMAEKWKFYIKKYWDVLIYLVFGVLTTVVNYLIYIPCYHTLGFSAALSNVLAWAVAVAFAYLTNKPLVFHSYDWSVGTVLPELSRFISCRAASGVLETGILLVTVDLLGWNGLVWKLITSVLVVVLNDVGSKLLVFRKKK